MPYVSDQQRKWAHTDTGEKALGGPAKVAEWDAASKGKKLPKYANKTKTGMSNGMGVSSRVKQY